ncbi:universal stress protein [Desulfopila aestuarii]|uniref:Nucleotide-binding universal stress protein, UspA family n=1 Tax=Desulfopila aestuarii DSM 18488 TaxID=1121416 RepID=A0A1M7YBK1_9BACT|nr:universal stress protein [Desulfopila aestuarii]SHO50002.1 Nucleotide-binding universal stress protein, UspA family [Desulfopila aestuarii DSM 18488]
MKILVGYSGKNIGQDLLQLAAQHAKAFQGEVIIATSMVGGDKTTREKVIEAEDNLKEVQDFFKKMQIQCETHLLVRNMTAGEDIVEFAKEQNVDEIIIGVKSRSKVGKLLFGSTAQFVILKAHCPVVSVK